LALLPTRYNGKSEANTAVCKLLMMGKRMSVELYLNDEQ
jgi:hypothetical protein